MKLFERGVRYKLKVPYHEIYTHIEPTKETCGKTSGECWPFTGVGQEAKTANYFAGLGTALVPLPKFSVEDVE